MRDALCPVCTPNKGSFISIVVLEAGSTIEHAGDVSNMIYSMPLPCGGSLQANCKQQQQALEIGSAGWGQALTASSRDSLLRQAWQEDWCLGTVLLSQEAPEQAGVWTCDCCMLAGG